MCIVLFVFVLLVKIFTSSCVMYSNVVCSLVDININLSLIHI